MDNEHKVDVSDLKPGMYVTRLDRSWLDSPFPFQGFLLDNWQQVAEVQDACEYVYVELEEDPAIKESKPATRGVLTAQPDSRPKRRWGLRLSARGGRKERRERGFRSSDKGGRKSRDDRNDQGEAWENRLARQVGQAVGKAPPVTVSIEEEIRAARPLIQETRGLVLQHVEDARHGRSLDTQAARECVEDLTESVLRNPDALVCLSALKKRDEYTYLHSMSVCILSISFGRYLGLPRETLRELGFGAFLHDIGKMHIPDNVLNKPGPLTPDEMEIMRKHPEYGMEIVDGSERIPSSSRNVIFSHHERLDGSGYTEGVSGANIHPLTHIVSVCDIYDAIISQRPYKMPCSPMDATGELYRTRGRLFEVDLVHQFIACIGIYPVGSLVELTTGEVGVVVATNKVRLRPKVRLVLDEEHRRLENPYEIDLVHQVQTADGRSLDIKRSLETGAYGLEPPSEVLNYIQQM